MKRHCIVLCWLMIFPCQAFAQAEAEIIDDLLEELAAEGAEEDDFYSLVEDMASFLEYPLNINTAGSESLERLHLLTAFQIQSLIKYRDENGPLASVYELPYIYGFDRELTEKILPFICLHDKTSNEEPQKRIADHTGGSFLVRAGRTLETRKGYLSDSSATDPAAAFLGDPWKLMARFTIRHGEKLSFGFTGEKDAGEPFMSNPNTSGFDFYSGYMELRTNRLVKYVVAGDYHARFGQGLACWSGFGFRKSPLVLNTRKRGGGLTRYESTDENAFLRGAGMMLAHNNLELIPFISYKHLDASVDEATGNIRSFITTGLHTTPSEFMKKDAVREIMTGGHLSWKPGTLELGITALHQHFDRAVAKGTEPYQFFTPHGSTHVVAAMDYLYRQGKILLFGEAAVCNNPGTAILQGVEWMMSEQVIFTALYRNFSRGYHALYSRAFCENTRTGNEQGLYMAAVVKPAIHWTITAYHDAYRFPWLKYGVDRPSGGQESFLGVSFKLPEDLALAVQVRREEKDRNLVSPGETMDVTGTSDRRSLRCQADYRGSPSLLFRTRLEGSVYHMEGERKETGFLAFQEISYQPAGFPLQGSLRFSLFDTDGYESRIYAFERDIPGSFSVPGFQGKGIRNYLYLKYIHGKHLQCWLRLSQTCYPGKTSIGSGLNEIKGATLSDIRLQLRYSF